MVFHVNTGEDLPPPLPPSNEGTPRKARLRLYPIPEDGNLVDFAKYMVNTPGDGTVDECYTRCSRTQAQTAVDFPSICSTFCLFSKAALNQPVWITISYPTTLDRYGRPTLASLRGHYRDTLRSQFPNWRLGDDYALFLHRAPMRPNVMVSFPQTWTINQRIAAMNMRQSREGQQEKKGPVRMKFDPAPLEAKPRSPPGLSSPKKPGGSGTGTAKEPSVAPGNTPTLVASMMKPDELGNTPLGKRWELQQAAQAEALANLQAQAQSQGQQRSRMFPPGLMAPRQPMGGAGGIKQNQVGEPIAVKWNSASSFGVYTLNDVLAYPPALAHYYLSRAFLPAIESMSKLAESGLKLAEKEYELVRKFNAREKEEKEREKKRGHGLTEEESRLGLAWGVDKIKPQKPADDDEAGENLKRLVEAYSRFWEKTTSLAAVDTLKGWAAGLPSSFADRSRAIERANKAQVAEGYRKEIEKQNIAHDEAEREKKESGRDDDHH